MGRTWAVASGSGGAGKTTIALSLAIGAAHKGNRTILLDASGVSRSCDILLGMESIMAIDMADVLLQQTEIQAALYPVPRHENLRIANVSLCESIPVSELSGVILALQSMCDTLVIDLPTGQIPVSPGILTEHDEVLFVVRPDDASVRSTEKVMQQVRGHAAGFSLILNHVRRDRVKKGLQYGKDDVAMLLDCPVIGVIAEDDSLLSGREQGKKEGHYTHWMNSQIREILTCLLSR